MLAKNKLGVALSGGGYRASAFHIGTLRALHKMNLIDKVDVLSTISGGSITGAYYCLFKGDFAAFEAAIIQKLQSCNLIRYVLLSTATLQLVAFTLLFLIPGFYLLFTPFAWGFPIILGLWIGLLLKFQFIIFPTGKALEKGYDKYYYNKASLKDLCARPLLAIGSSNLETGRPFTFSKIKMTDSTYEESKPPIEFNNEIFPVARAVTASSCVPTGFTPVNILPVFFKEKNDVSRCVPKLVDGGVYDNQGIQKLTQTESIYSCETIICSDAGGKLSTGNEYKNTISLLSRTVDLFMNRIKMLQMIQDVYNNVTGAGRPIAYFSLGWDLKRCIPGFIDNMVKGKVIAATLSAHGLQPDWIQDPEKFRAQIQTTLEKNVNYQVILANSPDQDLLKKYKNTKTSLTPFTLERIKVLAQHAENLTELQVKLYCPNL